MTECPNCLTPWKCNGPHMTDDLPPPEPHLKLMWRDGQYRVSRANVDWMDCYTADQMRAYGDARAAAAVAQERERTKALRKLLMKASGTMSCERWSTDFREQVYFAIRDGK